VVTKLAAPRTAIQSDISARTLPWQGLPLYLTIIQCTLCICYRSTALQGCSTYLGRRERLVIVTRDKLWGCNVRPRGAPRRRRGAVAHGAPERTGRLPRRSSRCARCRRRGRRGGRVCAGDATHSDVDARGRLDHRAPQDRQVSRPCLSTRRCWSPLCRTILGRPFRTRDDLRVYLAAHPPDAVAKARLLEALDRYKNGRAAARRKKANGGCEAVDPLAAEVGENGDLAALDAGVQLGQHEVSTIMLSAVLY
jgi:hypothetical protein